MQNYKEINGNDYVKDSRTTINETMRSIQSMNSGTVFPTTNLFEGMKCYRTDLKKTYTLTDVENNTWVEDDTASKLSTARKINITGDATGTADFDGSGDVSINTTVNESKHAAAADTATTANAMNNQGDKTAIGDGTKEPAGLNLYKVYFSGYPVWYGNLLSIGGRGGGELLAEWSGMDKGIGHLYYRNRRDTDDNLWSDWRTVAFTSDINSYAPTLTGSGASGTWPISISGNAAGLSGDLVFPDIGSVGTSNKISWSGSTDGADIYYQTTGVDQGNLVLNLLDDNNCYLRIACNGEFKSYFSPSDGNFHGNVNGNADTATNADSATNARLISPFEIGTADAFRNVWFSDSGTSNKACYSPNIQYNPATNVLKVGTVQGTATNADTVDGYHASDIINSITAANTGGIVAASLTENGYVKFANGLILQWGNCVLPSPSWHEVKFPIKFPNACYIAASCVMAGGAGDPSGLPVTGKNYSQNSFFAAVRDGYGWHCNWFAIGN